MGFASMDDFPTASRPHPGLLSMMEQVAWRCQSGGPSVDLPARRDAIAASVPSNQSAVESRLCEPVRGGHAGEISRSVGLIGGASCAGAGCTRPWYRFSSR